eukprot:262694-Chlamydomonas_euryale.AAC.2
MRGLTFVWKSEKGYMEQKRQEELNEFSESHTFTEKAWDTLVSVGRRGKAGPHAQDLADASTPVLSMHANFTHCRAKCFQGFAAA